MKKQVKAALLVAAGSAVLAVGMTACTEPKKPEPATAAQAAGTAKEDVAHAASNPAAAKPKDHPAH